MANNGNFILPASTQHADTTKAGVVKIGSGINVDATGIISTDITTLGAAAKLNTLMNVDANGASAGGNVVIKRTTGSKVDDMQRYISIWVATYKKANNGNLSQNAYKTFINGTINDTLVATDPTTIYDVNGVAFSAADYTKFGLTIGSPIPQFNGKYPDGLRKIFEVQDSTGVDLFTVKANGDTNIAGIIEINGTGLSKFNGDVQVGGNLTVLGSATVKGIMSGNMFEITGDLKVDGKTYLGDDASADTTTIKGYTSIQQQYTKAEVQTAVDSAITAWKAAHPAYTMSDLNNYRIAPIASGAGNSLAADVSKYIDSLAVIDKNGLPIFEVKSNGDTVIGGVLSVNGAGESYFQGDVNINGSLVVEKTATIKGIMSGNSLELTGDLKVDGNTTLGDNAGVDTTLINGLTTIKSPVTKDAGSPTTNVFQVLDASATPLPLFEVKQNGDTVIAGKLTVNSTGSSFAGNTTFQGDVNIGGSLTVAQDATVAADLSGNNMTLTGNLVVKGNTQLGDVSDTTDPAQYNDTLTIYGKSTVINTGIDTTDGVASTSEVFGIHSLDSKNLFQVFGNGDTKIGGNLTITKDAIVNANMTGNDLTVNGNLVVKGNTTLGDGSGGDKVTFSTNTTIDLGANRLTNAADPVQSQDVATKQYVDNVVTGLDVKQSVKAATVGNITLSGLQTIDGISINEGDRVLVKDQTDKTTNGIYLAHASAWTRSADADNSPTPGAEVSPGMFTFVEQGTKNANTGWVLITVSGVTSINLGTSQITFSQFAGAGSVTTGTGIDQNGTTITLKPATYTQLGGVIVGQNNFTVDGLGNLSLNAATSANLGGVKVVSSLTNGVQVDASGLLSTVKASATQYGVVQVGTGLSVTDGVISVGTVSGGASLDNVSQEDVANSIAQRTSDGSLKAHDLTLTGKVTSVNNITTAGNYGVQTVVAASNGLVDAGTTSTTIASFTPTVNGTLLVYLYFKVSTAASLDLTVNYNDGDPESQVISAQSNGNQTVGAYSVAPLYIYTIANQPVSIIATASALNTIKVNASIAAL